MRAPLLALLLAAPAHADPAGEDLPTMARKYGLGTVAAVVRSASGGDVTTAQVHATLRALGLDRVTMPVVVDAAWPAEAPGPVTGCGWNEGVFCAVALPPGAPAAPAARCVGKRGPLDVAVPLVVDPAPTAASPGTAHLGDLLPCWEAGGVRVSLAPPPPPVVAPPRFDGWTEAGVRAWVAPFAIVLADCGRSSYRLTIARPGGGPADVVLRDGGLEDVPATLCARRAAGGALDAVPAGADVDVPAAWVRAAAR